jgi:hypothetical protein
MVSTDSFLISMFLTEKEKRDRQLVIELRAKGVITAPRLPFEESRRKEIDSLLRKGVFKLVSIKDILRGTRIFDARLIDEVKGQETASPYKKLRLVVQAYNDPEKIKYLTQASTIQRISQRVILLLAPLLVKLGMSVHLRDIT